MSPSDKENKEVKIAKITALFDKLYCFTSSEINGFLEKIRFFPEEGLDKMIAALEDGKIQQDELIRKRCERDKDFPKEFGRFLNKTTVKIKDKWEQAEHEKAEDILADI